MSGDGIEALDEMAPLDGIATLEILYVRGGVVAGEVDKLKGVLIAVTFMPLKCCGGVVVGKVT